MIFEGKVYAEFNPDIRKIHKIYRHTDVHWLEKNIQNMISQAKFHTESNGVVRKIQKID